MKLSLMLLVQLSLALAAVGRAESNTEFADLEPMRIFNQLSPQDLRSLFHVPEASGVRRVRNMKRILQLFSGKKGAEETGDPRVVASYVPAYFKLERASDWEFPNSEVVVEKFEVQILKTEADDASWPAATFLRLGKSWVLLPEFACAGPCGTAIVAKGDVGNQVVLARADHAFSGERGTVVVTSLNIHFGEQGPAIEDIRSWQPGSPLLKKNPGKVRKN